MDSLYEDLFLYLDYDRDGTVDVSELQEGLEDLGVIQTQVGVRKLRMMSAPGPLERPPEAD